MVNDLKRLLRDNAETEPSGDVDVAEVVRVGRQRRTRRRRSAAGVGAAAAVAAVVGGLALTSSDLGSGNEATADRVQPVGPVLSLEDARPAVEGTDYRVLASHTNDNLEQANGQYYSGVTDDGLLVFTDGPHTLKNSTRVALVDPASGETDWLPGGPQQIEHPIALGADALVFGGVRADHHDFSVRVFDRASRSWSSMEWPTLPGADLFQAPVEHGGRLYLALDPDSDIQRFDLWSVSLTDPADVRNEQTVVGEFDITGDELTWTNTHNEPNNGIHVRDLITGDERDFDPQSGDRCNQLGLQRLDDLIVLQQYCGTKGGVRDDRAQIITMDGDPVVTIQDDGVELGRTGGSQVVIDSYHRRLGGAYVYDPDAGDLVRISDQISSYYVGGPVPAGSPYFLWHTPVNGSQGATQWLGEWLR